MAEEFVRKEQFGEFVKRMDERFDHIQKDMTNGFAYVNQLAEQRYESINQRLADADKARDQNLVHVNQRFDDMNQRFDDMNRRFDDMNRSMNQRFDDMNQGVNQRFDDMNHRFDDMNQGVNQRFDDMNRSMNYRFDNLDKRFDDQRRIVVRLWAAIVTAVVGAAAAGVGAAVKYLFFS